jgi:hypothetical protein
VDVALTLWLVERGSLVGLGHCCRQLRHLPESHHGSLWVTRITSALRNMLLMTSFCRHRMPSQPGIRYQRGMHRGMGNMQRKRTSRLPSCCVLCCGLFTDWAVACISLPLHLQMAKSPPSVSTRQQRLGVPEIWKIKISRAASGEETFAKRSSTKRA